MRMTKRRQWAAIAACCAMVFASVIIAAAGGLAVAAPADEADHLSQRELAASALQGALHTSDSRLLDSGVRQAHRMVAGLASRAPDQQGSASVVFDTGMTSAELAGFAARHELGLYAVEAKVPAASSGEVHTMWFNDVARVTGSPETKLDRLTGSARLRYFQQAEAAPSKQRAALREVAEGDYRFYRAEVVASHARLAALVDAPSVRAVLPDTGDRKVTELRAAQAAARAVEAAMPDVEVLVDSDVSARTQRGKPVVTTTGQRCHWQSTGVLACGAGNDDPVSGDPAVDAALPRTDDSMVAGTNESSPSDTRVTAMDDSSVWTGCNNSTDGQACPNDNVYRPHANTGGAEAFGVAINNYRANEVLYACYAEWVPDPGSEDGSGGYWRISCYPYAIVTEAFTYGAARWDSRWGTQTTTVAALNQIRFVSTLAFKADGFQPCVVSQFLATAECSRSQQNSVFVPNTGLEDELLIANPACNPTPIAGRIGHPDDRRKGCFYPSYATSTLPAPFLDTTFGDGQDYNLAVGSSSPWALVEGRNYSSYAEFWAYGNNNMTGKTAHHSVAVDSRVNEAAICRLQQTDPFCYFPVDSSRVSPIRPFV